MPISIREIKRIKKNRKRSNKKNRTKKIRTRSSKKNNSRKKIKKRIRIILQRHRNSSRF